LNTVFISFISDLELGEVQCHENLRAIPLFYKSTSAFSYITLKEAMEKNLLTISEVSQSGNVPNLKVLNNADMPVLLLDGEELVGAKQNRVLNTTILLKAKSETVIPVSCTEHGRWQYRSRVFADSDIVMPSRLRSAKSSSVSESLDRLGDYESDQCEVWDRIAELSRSYCVASPTGAMKEVFEANESSIKAYVDAIKLVPGQRGIIFLIGNQVAGMDVLSNENTYKSYHAKLVKSYAVDSMISKNESNDSVALDRAKEFLKEATLCNESRHESVGYGWDCRFRGESIIGSALLYNDEIIHMALFKTRAKVKDDHFASFNQRSRNRG
jgi:hypothetical protein